MHYFIRVISSQPQASESVGTRGLNAISKIDGVANPEVIAEDGGSAVLRYSWTRPGQRYMDTETLLERYGLRKDWDYDPLGRKEPAP